jgi:hypothetical protein
MGERPTVPDTTANSIGTAYDSAVFTRQPGINVIYAGGGAYLRIQTLQARASKEQGSTPALPRLRFDSQALPPATRRPPELSVLHLSQVAGHVQ